MMLESEAPLYTLLELAAPLWEGQLSAGPRLDPKAGGDKNGA